MKIAILDDYQDIALKIADWSLIPGNPEIKVFSDHHEKIRMWSTFHPQYSCQ